jgi:hypothetical protein
VHTLASRILPSLCPLLLDSFAFIFFIFFRLSSLCLSRVCKRSREALTVALAVWSALAEPRRWFPARQAPARLKPTVSVTAGRASRAEQTRAAHSRQTGKATGREGDSTASHALVSAAPEGWTTVPCH